MNRCGSALRFRRCGRHILYSVPPHLRQLMQRVCHARLRPRYGLMVGRNHTRSSMLRYGQGINRQYRGEDSALYP